MNKNSHRRLIILIVLFFFLIPLLVSLFYGNIPLYKNANTYNNVQSGTMYGDQSNSLSQGNKSSSLINNPAFPHYSSLEAKYYTSKAMTFSHVFRDMSILLIVSIIAMLLERNFRILDGLFRR